MCNKFNIEFREFKNDDFSNNPKCFSEEFLENDAILIRHDICGMINLVDDIPHYYFHNMNRDASRWSGFIRLGRLPLSLQTKVEGAQTSQTDPLIEYNFICNDILTYGIKTKSGIYMDFTFNENGCHIVEGENGDILDVNGKWFPNGLICHFGSEYNIPFMHLPVHLKGTYRGKKVEFLACIDRIFSPKGKEKEIIENATNYVSSYCSGIREDGRREWFVALICHANKKGLGIYWIEGEEPIISNEVINEGIWQRLPYVDDGTVVCLDNIWKFGGKEFHVVGKWGSKGFTIPPRLDRHGQSQIFGIWFEGNVPYKHICWNTFSENMGAFYNSMKNRGFIVED